MSHAAITLVISGAVPENRYALEAAVEEALKPYDENLVVDLHSQKGERWVTSKFEQLAAMERHHGEIRSLAHERYATQHYQDWASEYENTANKEDLLEDWDGCSEGWDDEGWPMTTRNYADKGKWDYWRIGGRFAGGWVLKPGIEPNDLAKNLKLGYWDSPDPSEDERDPSRTYVDCARIRELEPESIRPTFAWVGIDGEWHDRERWVEKPPAERRSTYERDWSYELQPDDEFEQDFMKWLLDQPQNAYLVKVDFHS